MMMIEVTGAQFFALHGFYPEEQVLGNQFIVDIRVEFLPGGTPDDMISNTVDYEQLYRIAREEMKLTKKLLEGVAQAIISRIRTAYPFIEAASVCIKKLNPPMGGQTAYAGVTIIYRKENELQ